MMNKLRGIVPPVVTPLRSQTELDTPGLVRLVDHLVTGGVAGLFILGTTGEGPALSSRLRFALVEQTAIALRGRKPLLVGVSDTSLEESIRLAEHAAQCRATAVVATPTYYFPRTEREHVRYFQLLADRSPLPVFVYNMPACVGVNLSVDAVRNCTPHPNIVGLKDSGGNLAIFRGYLTLREQRPDWSFLIGPEHLLADAVLAGGDGGVHAGANFLPELFVSWFHAADQKDQAEVERLRETVLQLGRIYEVGGDFLSVARGIKCALSIRGICSDVMAEPATAYEDEQRLLINCFVDELIGAEHPVLAPGQ